MNRALAVSLIGNVVLLAAVVWIWNDTGHGASEQQSEASGGTESPLRTLEREKENGGGRTVQKEKTEAVAFAELEKAGLSKQTVVNAFLEEFQRRWDRKFQETQKRYAPRNVPDRVYIELSRERDAAQIVELKALLGEAGYREWDKNRLLETVNAGGILLTPEEAERAYVLQKTFEEEHEEYRRAMEDGVADMADVTALQNQARERLDQQMETLLGAERLAAARGISDPIAEIVQRLGDLNPTRQQAEAVQRWERESEAKERSLAERVKTAGAEASLTFEELRALEAARDAEMGRIFGEEAYAKMKRQSDPIFQTLERYAAAWNLSGVEVATVYDSLSALQREVHLEQAAARLQSSAGKRVNWEDVESAIARLQAPTEARLLEILGPERYKRLKANGLLTVR